MELIALKDFRNVNRLRLKQKGVSQIKDAIHADHIHKGAVFSIGSSDTLDELQKTDPETAQVVATLALAGCVGDATDKDVVESVKQDLAIDKKREATTAKLNEAANATSLVQQLVTALKGGLPAAK